jgi:hypothetical protein
VESGGQLPRTGTTPTLGITVLYVLPREGSMTHMHDSQKREKKIVAITLLHSSVLSGSVILRIL